ncbi:MAG TPA: polysaccharide biosynthesis C-terminal domain-containing protein [Methylomirabilota bacterium]|nr:polysaccharide biosynthesis C-terminal domain-containing protein [Methylomirabilota bacterium]
MSPCATSARLQAARPVLANTSALVILRGSNLAVRLGLLFLIARAVQPQDFGRLVLALSVAEVGKVLADFGMDTLAIREYALAADRGAVSRFAGSFAAGRVVCAALVQSGLIAWFLLTQAPEQAAVGVILSFSVWTSLLQGFSLDWFQGRLRVPRVVWPVLTANVLGGAAAAFVASSAPGLGIKALALPALELLVGGVLLFALRREESWALGAPSVERMRALLRASLPIAITAILIMLYSRLDVFVMAGRLPAVDLGRYGIAMRLTEPFQIAAAVFGLSVYSRFAAWFSAPEARAAAPAAGTLGPSAVRYAAGTLAYGVTVGALLAVVGPVVLAKFLPAYLAAVPPLRLLAGALVFRSLNATLAGIIQAAGRFRALALLAAWNLALVFVLLLVLVPRAGAEGAALALLLGEGLNTVFQLVWVARIVSRRERSAADGG